MPKRKPRRMTKGIDFLKPIDIKDLGTENDPCFGKHNSPKAPECMKCGDCELCAVVTAQNLIGKRTKVEGKQKFKDLEKHPKQTLKSIRIKIKEYLKPYRGQYIAILDIINYSRQQNLNESLCLKAIASMVKKYPNKYKYNKSKTKVQWIIS